MGSYLYPTLTLFHQLHSLLSTAGQRDLPLAHQGIFEGHDCLGMDDREGQGG